MPAFRVLSSAGNRPLVPKENIRFLFVGILTHIGPTALFIGLLCSDTFTAIDVITSFLMVSIFNLPLLLLIEHFGPCESLFTPTWREIREGLLLVFFHGALCGSVILDSGWWVLERVSLGSNRSQSWLLIIPAVILTDLAYYWLHRGMNHGHGQSMITRFYRRHHAVHHAGRTLDFLRGNVSSFFDTAAIGFQLPLILVATLLQMDLPSTLAAYFIVLLLQATHHLNHTFNLGWLRYVFVDNHAHKLHHCKRGSLVNFGALFAVWDLSFGTFYENWDLSANYMHKNRMLLPITKVSDEKHRLL